MQVFKSGPIGALRSIWSHRDLIDQLSKREIKARYRGAYAGFLWAVITPVLMLAIYTFVFSVVFKARWAGSESFSTTSTEFALVLFAGLNVHGMFSEVINRSPSLVLHNPNYVKKVVFPLEILPVVALIGSLFQSLISLIILVAAIWIVKGELSYTLFLLPVVWLPFCVLVLGLSWFLASLGVFVRDIGHSLGIVTSALLFLSPVFYPVDSLPERYQSFLYLNPLTLIIEETRSVMLFGYLPDWKYYLLYWLVSLSVFSFGFLWFQRTRRGFADVV